MFSVIADFFVRRNLAWVPFIFYSTLRCETIGVAIGSAINPILQHALKHVERPGESHEGGLMVPLPYQCSNCT